MTAPTTPASSPREGRLFAGLQMDRPEPFSFGGGRAALFTAAAPGRAADANEDALGVFPASGGRGVLAVADGLGGQPAGASASRRALRALQDAIQAAPPEAPSLRGALLDGLERASQEIRAVGSGAATTLVAAELDGDLLRPVHVGDSAMLVVGQRGRVKLQTIAHSPVGYAVEAGLLDEREALHHADRHIVSNAVGMADMRIEVGAVLRLAPRDTLLLASDGLFDNLLLDEIIEGVRRGPLLACAESLARTAQQRMAHGERGRPGKPDDVTFILFRLG